MLLTDFGLRDAYVGIMKGAILARNPAASIVDLCHQMPPQDVRRGAFLLATSVQYFPAGAIFVGVVDPGVGTERRAVALEAADWCFVGPDNGLFAWALRFMAHDGRIALATIGGSLRLTSGARAVQLSESRFWLPQVSTTFHGRDVFAPVAAELSLGRSLGDFGPPISELLDLAWPEPQRCNDGSVSGEVVTTDGFGNLITNLRAGDLPPSPIFEIGGQLIRGISSHFQSSEPFVAAIGSSGFLEIAAPNSNAARLLGAEPGSPLIVRPSAL